MILLNPAMAWFLPGMLLPLLLHLLWRRRVRLLLWGAMGPLRCLHQRHARRMAWERWGLLTLRTVLVGAVLLALCRPAWRPDAAADARGRRGRTAAVVLIDDSPSAHRGRRRRSWDHMQEMAAAYIAGLRPGDELSVLLGSQVGTIHDDPRFDHQRVADWLAGREPTDVASDLPALIDAGLEQAARHINPALEMVLVTDAADDGWGASDDLRGAALEGLLREHGDARLYYLRGNPLPADKGHHAVAAVDIVHDLVPVGDLVPITVRLHHWGRMDLPRTLGLQLLVDDQLIEDRMIQVTASGPQEVVFHHRFPQAGTSAIAARIIDAEDENPVDAIAWRSISVIDQLPVLLVEGAPDRGRFLAAALAAAVEGRRSFAIERCHFGDLDGERLAGTRVVALLDVPALQSEQVAALERFVVSGGGLLVSVTPAVDAERINRFWYRGGDGFLPAAIAARFSVAGPQTIRVVDRGHPALAGLPDDSAWSLRAEGLLGLERGLRRDDAIQVILRREDGHPFCITRRRGAGTVALWASALDRRAGGVVLAPVFAPLLRGLVHHLGSRRRPSTTVTPGERLVVLDAAPGEIHDPRGRPLVMEPTRWRGRQAWRSQVLEQSGVYRREAGWLVCAVDPRERGPGDADQATAWIERHEPRVFTGAAAVRDHFTIEGPQIREWWSALVAVALTACLVELAWLHLIARRAVSVTTGVVS